MTFPADVSISISAFHNEFETDFRNICAGFDSIECCQFAAQMEVSINSHLSKILMTRQQRDEFAFENNLVALRFMEHQRGQPQRRGVAGVVKVWVNTHEHMLALLDHLQYLGGTNRTILSNPLYPGSPRVMQLQHQQFGAHELGLSLSLQQQQSSARWSDSSSARSQAGASDAPNSASKYHIQAGGSNFPSPSKDISVGVSPPGERSVIRWPHSSFRFMFLGELLKRNMNALLARLRSSLGITTTCPYRDKTDAMACLLLESSSVDVLADATERVNEFMNTVLQAMVCVSIAVNQNQRKILMAQDLLRIKEIQGKCGVHIILDPQDADIARSRCCQDLRLPIATSSVPLDDMNGIGVGLGIGLNVGVVLGVDLEDPPVPVDDGTGVLVLPPPLPGQSLPRSEEGVLRSLTYVYPFDLISVGVRSNNAHSSVTVTVVNDEVRAVFGDRILEYYPSVGHFNLLLILDPEDEKHLTASELEKLNRGEVLVDSFSVLSLNAPVSSPSQPLRSLSQLDTGASSPGSARSNTIIRARPEFIAFGNHVSSDRVLDGLERAIMSSLRMAESMGLASCVLQAPVANSLFASIDPETVVSTTMEAVVGFVQNSNVAYLRLLAVCETCPVSFKLQRQSPSSGTAPTAVFGALAMPGSMPQAPLRQVELGRAYRKDYFQPYCGSRLGAALLNIVDRDIDPIASVSASLSSRNILRPQDHSKMELLSLNMTIPNDLNVDAIVLATNPPSTASPMSPVPPLMMAGMGMKQMSPTKPGMGPMNNGLNSPVMNRQQQLSLPLGSSKLGLAQSQMSHLLPPGIPMIPSPLPQSAMQTILSPRIEPPSVIVVQGVPAGVMIALSYLRSVVQSNY
jgi:hypothetical protein